MNKTDLENNKEFKDTVLELIENEVQFDKKFKKVYSDLKLNYNKLFGYKNKFHNELKYKYDDNYKKDRDL